MKLTELLASNLKACNFKHRIGDITIFCGPNGVGKSARLDCLPLALFGYHPALKRTNGDIFDLSSGSMMSATAWFSDGSTASRHWSKSGTSVRCDVVSKVGDAVVPLCVDAREYFNLSDRDRTKLAFRLSGCQTEFGTAVVARAKGIQLEEHDADAEAVVTAICGEISKLWADSKVTPPEWLDEFAETAKKKCSAAQASAKKMSSTLEGLTELRQQSKQMVNQRAEQELAALNKRISKLTGDHRELQAKLTEATARYHRKIELIDRLSAGNDGELAIVRAELARLEPELAGYQSRRPEVVSALAACAAERAATEGALAMLAERLAQAQRHAARLAEAVEVLDPDGATERVRVEGERRLAEDGALVRAHQSETGAWRRRVQEAQSDAATLRAECAGLAKALQGNEQEQNALASRTCCPVCEAAEDGWNGRVLGKLQQKREGLLQSHAEQALALGRAQEVCDQSVLALAQSVEQDQRIAKLQLELAQAAANVTLATQNKCRAEAVLAEAPAVAEELLRAEMEQRRVALVAIGDREEQARLLMQVVAIADGANKSALDQLATLRAQERRWADVERANSRLQGELDSLAEVVDPVLRTDLHGPLMALDGELAALNQQVAGLTVQVRQANAQKGEVAAKLQAAEAALRVSREEQVWRKVKTIVDELQAEAVATSIGPILERANLIAGSILVSPLAYHEGRMGRFSGRVFIPVETFNASDKLVTFAAVCVALAAASGSPLKVLILDDLDHLGHERFEPLFAAIRAAIQQGVITQCIGALVRSGELAGLEGVEVVELTK